jgi:hypothetical protein
MSLGGKIGELRAALDALEAADRGGQGGGGGSAGGGGWQNHTPAQAPRALLPGAAAAGGGGAAPRVGFGRGGSGSARGGFLPAGGVDRSELGVLERELRSLQQQYLLDSSRHYEIEMDSVSEIDFMNAQLRGLRSAFATLSEVFVEEVDAVRRDAAAQLQELGVAHGKTVAALATRLDALELKARVRSKEGRALGEALGAVHDAAARQRAELSELAFTTARELRASDEELRRGLAAAREATEAMWAGAEARAAAGAAAAAAAAEAAAGEAAAARAAAAALGARLEGVEREAAAVGGEAAAAGAAAARSQAEAERAAAVAAAVATRQRDVDGALAALAAALDPVRRELAGLSGELGSVRREAAGAAAALATHEAAVAAALARQQEEATRQLAAVRDTLRMIAEVVRNDSAVAARRGLPLLARSHSPSLAVDARGGGLALGAAGGGFGGSGSGMGWGGEGGAATVLASAGPPGALS